MDFGEKDVQFGRDISFFAFDLPFYRFVLGFAFATVVVSIIAAAVTHYLYGGLRLYDHALDPAVVGDGRFVSQPGRPQVSSST